MTINVLFSAPQKRWDEYRGVLGQAFSAAGLCVSLSQSFAPDEVDYIVFAPNGPVSDFTAFTRLKAVLGLWAGVETVVENPTLTVPMTRMVDSGLREGMVEWVVGHVLRYHLGIDAQITGQDGTWAPVIPPLAHNRRVGVLGLGELGGACARALSGLNFDVHGWSRTDKNIAGVQCHSGDDGLGAVLGHSEILILLLPLTGATQNLINESTLSMLPRGARILNPGRGALIDDDALLGALDTGHIAHATLDVFRVEPLLRGHPYWAHPNVTVTPHLASETRPETASQVIAHNVASNEAGEAMQFIVDRKAGY